MPGFSLQKFRNKHFLALAGNGVISVMNLVQMSLIYHKLQITDVGNWVFFLSTIGILESVRTGFLSTATVKFYAGTSGKRADEVLGSIWFLALSLTGILVAVNLCCLPLMKYIPQQDLRVTINWVGVTFVSSLPYTLIAWILTAEERYDKILFLRMVNSLSMIAVIIVEIMFYKLTLERMLWINFLTNMLTNLVAILFGMARIKTLFRRSKACVAEIFHFGKFSLGTNLATNLVRNSDIYIIRILLGQEAVAIYNIPSKLLEIFEIPLRSFVGTGMSGMAIAYNNNNFARIKEILVKYAGMLTIAFAPLVLFSIIVAKYAVLIVSSKYYLATSAVNLFRIYIFCSLFTPIDRFNGTTLDVIHKPKINFYKTLIMLSTNIITDFVGIKIFGNLYGVAAGSFVTLLSGLIFGYIQLNRFLPYTYSEVFSTGFRESRQFITAKLFSGKK